MEKNNVVMEMIVVNSWRNIIELLLEFWLNKFWFWVVVKIVKKVKKVIKILVKKLLK